MSREDLQGAPDWVDPLLQVSNEFQEQATQQLNRNLLTGLLLDYKFVHGVELQIKNPLPDIPEGVKDVRCQGLEVDSSGKTTGKFYDLDVATVRWRPIQTQPSQPQRLGVTVLFAPPLGMASVCRTAAYSTPNAVNDPLPYDTTIFSVGAAALDVTNMGVSCSRAGVVFASYSFEWVASALGTDRKAFLWLNQSTATEIWGRVFHGPTTNAMSGSGLITVAAGDVVGVAHNQNTGGTLAFSGGIRRHKLDVHYVSPTIGTTGRVTLRFDGGN